MHTVKQIKASRKRHRCQWCSEFIEIGQPKTTESGVFEGDFFFRRTHPECYEAQERWLVLQPDEGEHCIAYPFDRQPRGGINPDAE